MSISLCTGCIHLSQSPHGHGLAAHLTSFHCDRYGDVGFLPHRVNACLVAGAFEPGCWIVCTGDNDCSNGSHSLEGWHDIQEDTCILWTHLGRCPDCGPDPWQPPVTQQTLFEEAR